MSQIISFISGFLIALFAEPIRNWLFKSVVSLSFEPRIGFGRRWVSLTPTTDPRVMAKYIRVLARNSSRLGIAAKGCRPFLEKIERFDPTMNGYKELHHDPLPLNWAYIGDQTLDIHRGMEFYFDVLEVNSANNSLRPNTTVPSPVAWTVLLREPGRYRFYVVLSGEDISPVRRTIEFEWKGGFESLTEDCF